MEQVAPATGIAVFQEAQAVDENFLGIHWAILSIGLAWEAVFAGALHPVRTGTLIRARRKVIGSHCSSAWGTANWRSGKRASRRWMAIRPSSRASEAPTQ